MKQFQNIQRGNVFRATHGGILIVTHTTEPMGKQNVHWISGSSPNSSGITPYDDTFLECDCHVCHGGALRGFCETCEDKGSVKHNRTGFKNYEYLAESVTAWIRLVALNPFGI